MIDTLLKNLEKGAFMKTAGAGTSLSVSKQSTALSGFIKTRLLEDDDSGGAAELPQAEISKRSEE